MNDIFASQECGSKICGEFTQCIFNDEQSIMECVCREGYSGDGQSCLLTANSVSCNVAENCSPYGSCHQESEDVFTCACLSGFIGDGYTCYLDTNFGVDTNFQSENIVPIPIDKISDYVLGGDYDHIPVEFGENPYDDRVNPPSQEFDPSNRDYNPYIALPGSGYRQPEISHDLNSNNVSPHHDTGSDAILVTNFDNNALRPAYPVDSVNIPAPYVPPQTPQQPIQPYMPQLSSHKEEVGIRGFKHDFLLHIRTEIHYNHYRIINKSI